MESFPFNVRSVQLNEEDRAQWYAAAAKERAINTLATHGLYVIDSHVYSYRIRKG
jgi:hypothetical protein